MTGGNEHTHNAQERLPSRRGPEETKGRTYRSSPRWPPVVALLNLTGLGLGYLYLKRWGRWLVHLLLTVGLIVTAFLTNAARLSALWKVALGAWLLWMALDGWLQARRSAQAAPAQAVGHRWLSVAVAVLLVGLEVAALWGYAALGQREFAAGMTAYWAGDCPTAMQHFNRVTTLYELTLSPNVADADAGIVECSLLVYAENARGRDEYADAVDGYQVYLHLYPESVLTIFVRDALAATYGGWATHLRQAREYQATVEKYQIILKDYPETPTGKRAAALAAETYAEWAADLRKESRYGEAIDKHVIVLSEYSDTPTGEQSAALAAEMYDEWGTDLREGGKYAAAIDKYQAILEEYPDAPAAAGATAAAAETYAEWAAQLREAGDYAMAVEKYQIVLGEYPRTPTAVKAEESIAETHAEWAGQLREAGDYEMAAERYQTILSEYPETSTAAEVEEEEAVAETYAEWAIQLREAGQYATAIRKYQTILGEYPETQPGGIAQVETGQTYNEWGRQLHSQRKYIEAMEKFTLTDEATDDPEVIAAAEEGYNDALWALSQDTTGEGREVMEQVMSGVCEGQPAESPAVGLAEDEPGKARFDGSEFTLPHDLKASSPGHFRYAICMEIGTSVLERCPYTGGHTLVRQRRWWRVRVRDTRTARVVSDRTFYGSSPSACPFSRIFWSTVDYSTGDDPSSDQIIDWLRGTVR